MRRALPLALGVLMTAGCVWFGRAPREPRPGAFHFTIARFGRAPREPRPGAFHFTIATYNLNNEDGANPWTLDAIREARADIVCLQEVTALWQQAIESMYDSVYPYRAFKIDEGGGAAGLGILSRFPLRDGGWHAGPNGWHPAWHHLVETPNGTFKVLNTHLRMATGEHGNALQSYLRAASDHEFEIRFFLGENKEPVPTIVVGDFNEGASGAAIRYLERAGFQNTLPLYHPDAPTWRYRHWIAFQFPQELDHILVDGAFASVNAWVVDGGASDHLAVVAHLEATRRF